MSHMDHTPTNAPEQSETGTPRTQLDDDRLLYSHDLDRRRLGGHRCRLGQLSLLRRGVSRNDVRDDEDDGPRRDEDVMSYSDVY